MRNSYIFFLLVLYTSLINASGFWSVVPIVIVDSLKNPIKCGYRYESPGEEIVLKLEKYVVNHHVITSFSVKNPNIKKTGYDADFIEKLLLNKLGIAVLSGNNFGENNENHIRISYASKEQNLKTALKIMNSFFNK